MTMDITVSPDNDGMKFFKLPAYLQQLAEEGSLINIMTRDDGTCENATIKGYDNDPHNPVLWVEDEEGDSVYVFIRHIISITPLGDEEEDEGDDDGTEFEEAAEEDA
jgi:hypothetical protein